jgi:hypothetical protein
MAATVVAAGAVITAAGAEVGASSSAVVETAAVAVAAADRRTQSPVPQTFKWEEAQKKRAAMTSSR